MNWPKKFQIRLRALFQKRKLEAEMDEEMRSHIEMRTQANIESGTGPEEARFAALRQFGWTESIKETCREQRGVTWLENLAQDVRYGARQLRKNLGFTAVAVLTLALGIGANTAIFSVVQAVLLAPLPYEQPGQLVRFYQQEPENASTRHYLTGPHFTAVRDHAASFENVAALFTYSETGLDLVKDGQAPRLRVLRVTSDYFRTLRSSPLRGRGFDRDDEIGTRRVVLSDRIWRTRFGSDPSVIGTTIQLSAEPYEVAAITPEGFEDPIAGEVDAWLPYNLAGDTHEENYSLTAVGRLRNGVSPEQARAELAVLSQSMKERWPAARLSAIAAFPLQEDLVATSRGPLHLLLIAVGLVLLVACVNVTSLVLVRATDRVHEFAIRTALGSGRGRLARQLLVESLLLAGFGGLLGLVMARLGINVLQILGHDAIPRLDEVGFDPVVLGFAVLITVATAVGFGVTPALRLVRISPNQALRQQARSATGTRGQGWVADMDPELVLHRAAPMTEVVGRGASRERFALVLMGAFASVSLLLAALGLYGVLAYTVRQRRQEIGIRMALGATAAQIRALVLREAALVLGTGLVVGITGALVLGRWLASLVFEISPWDPRILLATALLLTITGLVAAWLPARHASRMEPRIAMQEG